MPSFEKPAVTRPASIVIRFSDDSPYQKAVRLYTDLLDSPPVTQSEVFSSFQVGSDTEHKKKDIELRLELHPGDTTHMKNRTIIYWEIKPHKNAEAIKEIKGKLKSLGYGEEEKDDYSLMDDGAFIMSDGSDNFFGGHPNPPFPPGTVLFFMKRKHRFTVSGGLLVGLLGGLALASLLPGVLGLRRTGR